MTVVDSKAKREIQGSLDTDVRESCRVSEALGQSEQRVEQDSPYEPNTSSTFLTHWPLVFLEGKRAVFGVTFSPTNFPGASSGLYSFRNSEQTAVSAETVLFLFCLQLACSAPSNPHPSHWVAEEWDGAGVALVVCVETVQAEVHQEKHSSPGLKGGQTAAVLHPCRMKL